MRDSIIYAYVNDVLKRTMSYQDAVIWGFGSGYQPVQNLVKDLHFQRKFAPLSGTTLSPNSPTVLHACVPNIVNHLRF